ncbi:MAG: hypothetical protein ACOXZZ_01065 [Sphaerochaetaceae bacterium]|jgi:uncharacterized cysteine cluster protein YcgN (CxxCxxCC family)
MVVRHSSQWDQKCSRCGLCCHNKVVYGDVVVYDLSSYCEHYDPTTKECKIYFERLEKEARCKRVNRFRAMFASYLPETCAYVQWARSHKIRFAPKRFIRYATGDRGDLADEDSIPFLN